MPSSRMRFDVTMNTMSDDTAYETLKLGQVIQRFSYGQPPSVVVFVETVEVDPDAEGSQTV